MAGLGYDALILGATYGAIAPDGDLYDLSAVTLRNVEACVRSAVPSVRPRNPRSR